MYSKKRRSPASAISSAGARALMPAAAGIVSVGSAAGKRAFFLGPSDHSHIQCWRGGWVRWRCVLGLAAGDDMRLGLGHNLAWLTFIQHHIMA